jgi:hypothetical protein
MALFKVPANSKSWTTSLVQNPDLEHDTLSDRAELVAELASQYESTDKIHVKYWKMVKHALEEGMFDQDFKLNDDKIPKKLFRHIIIDFDYGVEVGPRRLPQDGERKKWEKMPGKMLSKDELAQLLLLTGGSKYVSNITLVELGRLASFELSELEAEFTELQLEHERDHEEALRMAGSKENAERARMQILMDEAKYFKEIGDEFKTVGNLAKRVLQAPKMLRTDCSLTLQDCLTAPDELAGKFLADARRQLRLEVVRTKYSAEYERALEQGVGEKFLDDGEGANGLCEALCRAMWGDETYAAFLDSKIDSEIEQNREWYAKRVGLASTHFAAGTGNRMTSTKSVMDFGTEALSAAMNMFDDENFEEEVGGSRKKKKKKKGAGHEQEDVQKKKKRHLCFVHVFVVGCEGLTLPEGAERIDPYCTITLGNQSFKTDTEKYELNPKYNSCCTFEVDSYQELMKKQLEVQISDEAYLERGKALLSGSLPSEILSEGKLALFQCAKPGSRLRMKVELEEVDVASAGLGYVKIRLLLYFL